MATEKLGRYEIISELGQGAMGVVYKAIDPLIERTVAIKTIKLDLSKEELANFEARFYREAKSAGCLNHPNIVTIYDVGKSGPVAYMAMEFLEGQALRELLDAHTALPIDKIVDIVAQVADGLAYAHENGIVHRDIKPANIMLVRDGMAKITDFGIAQMPTGSRTLAGTVLGSPKYMSPEQVIGQLVDGRADLFALGVVLYEMLTGESPFNGDNISTIMYRILNENPPPPKTLNPRIPEVFNYISAKALAKQLDERYQSAKELANDLRNYKTLVVPESATALLNRPRTLDRRAKPRFNMGEETLFLNQISGGLINGKTAADNDEIPKEQTVTVRKSSFWHGKNIMIAATVIPILAFSFTVLLSKPEKPEIAPNQRNIAAAPAPSAPEKALTTETPAPDPSINQIAPVEAQRDQTPDQTQTMEERETQSLPSTQPNGLKDSKPAHHKTEKHKQGASHTVSASVSAPQPAQDSVTDESSAALLSFAVTPWGEIYIDGTKAGVSPPLKELKVSAGKHRIEIRNLNFAPYSETIDMKPESTKKIKFMFK